MICRILILALLPWLVACFEHREEVWIESDGSGRIAVDSSFPSGVLASLGGADGLRSGVTEWFDQVEGLKLDGLEIERKNGQVQLSLRASADSMLDLRESTQSESDAMELLPPGAKHFMGDVEVKLDGLSVDMRRQLNLKNGFGLAALGVSRRDRETKHVTFIMHLPVEATEHNATRTEDGGRTLIWDHTLGQALAAPIELHFKTPLPIPWGWVAAGGLAVLFVIGGLIRLWHKRRQRHRRTAS